MLQLYSGYIVYGIQLYAQLYVRRIQEISFHIGF